MAKISQMVASRVATAEALTRAARDLAEELGSALGPQLGGREGFEARQLRALILSQADYLEETTRRMREAEQAYVNEQDDDISLRGRLAEASIELDRKLRLTREHIREAEGMSALQIYGLQTPPPRARAALVSYARNVIDLLSAHPYTFTGELGQALETRTVAVLLNELLEPFERLVHRMESEMSELQDALRERNAHLDAWVEIYRGVSRTMEGLCRLAGKREAAEHFTPSFERAPGALDMSEITESEAHHTPVPEIILSAHQQEE